MGNIIIKVDDLSDGFVEALLQEHLKEMHKYSPVESIHALDTSKFRDPKITFWSAWVDAELAACGALKELDLGHAEIKSMRTSKPYLRKGFGAKILQHILAEAKARSYSRVSLETGTNDAFLPARKLYEQFGFKESGPFAGYTQDTYSTFYTRELSGCD